jgi:hypothetical protein
MTLHAEQVKLLYHDDYRWFIRSAHGYIMFGKVLRIEEYVARELVRLPLGHNAPRLATIVHDYLSRAANEWVASTLYSTLHPEGSPTFTPVAAVWPIPKSLFKKAKAVDWDLMAPDAPIDEVEAVIQKMKEVVGNRT